MVENNAILFSLTWIPTNLYIRQQRLQIASLPNALIRYKKNHSKENSTCSASWMYSASKFILLRYLRDIVLH